MTKLLQAKPITIKTANDFIKDHHRHHRRTSRNCGRWAISAIDHEKQIVGVVIAGNPVSASYMDGLTIEITRLCANQNAPKGTCSFLLSLCCKIWKTMGGNRIITYTLHAESGSSLKGAGWIKTGIVKPHKGWTYKSKSDGKHRDTLSIYECKKIRWEKHIAETTNECKTRNFCV